MNRFEPIKAHAAPLGVTPSSQVYTTEGATGKFIRIVGAW